MEYVLICVVILIVVFNICFLGYESGKGLVTLLKKGILPGQLFIYDKLIKNGYLSKVQVRKDMELLGEGEEELIRLEYGKRLTLANLIIVLGCVCAVVLGNNGDSNIVNKPSYYEGTKELNIEVDMNDSEGKHKKENILLTIDPYRMTEEAFDELVDEVVEYIYEELPGENKSIDEISKPINMVTIYPDNEEVTIEWVTDEDGYIDSYGNIDEFPKGDEVVELLAIISCHGYEATVPVNICIIKGPTNEREHINEQIQLMVNEQSKEKDNKTIELPEEIDGVKLTYHIERNDSSVIVLIVMSVIAGGVVVFGKDYDNRKKAALVRDKMEREYSHIISKLVLLMKSGMSITKAWRKLALDGCNCDYSKSGIYELMGWSVREMDSGVSFQLSAKNFAMKTQCESYVRLVTYINQNLSKGTDAILHIVELELIKASQERKNAMLREGEKAGTKMILPMTVLLIIVLMITVIPGLMLM